MSSFHKQQHQSKSNLAQQSTKLSARISTMEAIQQEENTTMGLAFEKVQEDLNLLKQSINRVKEFEYHHPLGISPDLEQAEEMFKSVVLRNQEIIGIHHCQHAEMSDFLQQERENLKSLCQSSSFQSMHQATEENNYSLSTKTNQQQNQNQSKPFSSLSSFFRGPKRKTSTEALGQKSDLKMEDVISYHQRMDKMGEVQQQQHKKMRSDLKQVEENIREVQHRIHWIETSQQKKIHERLREVAEELRKMRSVLKEKEEELKSFKDRVALEVAPSIKTGNTISLNSPVSKNRIREMYETLRCDWPAIKEILKSNGKKPDAVKKWIQEQFSMAKTNMEEKKKMISEVFDLKNETESPKIKEYIQLTIQNLQLALYNQKYDEGSQKPSSAHEIDDPKEMMTYLGSECYWLGCLMALNNPAIHPDWENHPPSMDKWDILPRNIAAISEKKKEIIKQQGVDN